MRLLLLTRLLPISILGLILAGCSNSKNVASVAKEDASKATKAQAVASEPTYYKPDHEDYTTHISDDTIKTLLIHRSDSELEYPIIQLNGTNTITLQFDDLSENVRDMYYRFKHCTADWEPSNLRKMDYQTGFNSDIIDDYAFSFNTLQKYTHYKVDFPNDAIQFTLSGNYVIEVFADSELSIPILTARFMIVEPLTSIQANIKPSSVVVDRNYRQEVDIKVNLGSVETTSAYRDIKLVVMQNNRWDNLKRGVKPSFVKGRELIYDFQKELTFDGINEYRHLDAKSVHYRSENVARVQLQGDRYHIYMTPDIPRAFKNYSYEQDLNGKLLIKNDDMQNAALESDYITVHFSMPVDALLGNGDLYLFGQLSNYQLSKPYRLTYNPANLAYETSIKLKQGYYNYLYFWRYKNQDEGTTQLTEGNHSETENEYTVLVYFHDNSTFSDRLVGYRVFNSFKK